MLILKFLRMQNSVIFTAKHNLVLLPNNETLEMIELMADLEWVFFVLKYGHVSGQTNGTSSVSQ